MAENKIGYLIIREELFSPLVKTQVIDLLIEIASKEEKKIILIWACRIDYFLKKKQEFKHLKEKLSDEGIEIKRIPIIIGKFPLNIYAMKVLLFQTINPINKFIEKEKIQILHCRGYNAANVAINIKERNKKLKVIFDTRSPYLTELRSTYGLKEKSEKYLFWESSEKKILNKSDCIIAISKESRNYLKSFTKQRVLYIPNNVTLNSEVVFSNPKKEYVISYVGSIGYGWNDVRIYANFVKNILDFEPRMKFNFYVNSTSVDLVVSEFTKRGIPQKSYSVTNVPNDQIQTKIKNSLAGLQIMSSKDVRLGVKTVEYLAAGLPIICNQNAVSANYLVHEYGVGIQFEENYEEIISFLNLQFLEHEKMSKNCKKIANENFSTEKIAKDYNEIYDYLIGEV